MDLAREARLYLVGVGMADREGFLFKSGSITLPEARSAGRNERDPWLFSPKIDRANCASRRLEAPLGALGKSD